MRFSTKQLGILREVAHFCDANVDENKVSNWVESCGLPDSIYADLLESDLGKYCRPSGHNGDTVNSLDRVTMLTGMTRKAGATLPFITDILSSSFIDIVRSQPSTEVSDQLMAQWNAPSFSEAFSEANAGVAASNVETTVFKSGSKTLLKGSKSFVSGGQILQKALVLANDPVYGERDGGFSLWLVPLSVPGVSTLPLDTIGQEMLAAAVIRFSDVVLESEWRVHTDGRLQSIMERQYTIGRIVICASSLGLALAAKDDAVAYSRSHVIKGRKLGSIPQIQEKLADMQTKTEAMAHFIADAAIAYDKGSSDFVFDCALAKRYVPRAAVEVSSDALQIMGGRGYTNEERVGRIWRDCRGNQIAQGTDEIMARFIAKRMLSQGEKQE